MASKRRIRRKSCTSKVRYETEQDAKNSAMVATARRKEVILPYRCRFCGGYHTGHAFSRVVRKMWEGDSWRT